MLTRAAFRYKVGAQTILYVPGDFAGGTINQGIQEKINTAMTDFGELKFAEIETNQRQVAFTLNYGRINKQNLPLLMGSPLIAEATTAAIYQQTFKAVALTPALTTGQHGFSMVADNADSLATSTDAFGKSVPLTRQPFASFVPATPLTFAQGANGSYKFSDDLITAGSYVSVYTPYPVADSERIGHEGFGLFQVDLQGVLQYQGKKEVYQVRFSEAQLNRQDNSNIDFAASPVPIQFRDLSPACQIDFRFLNRRVAC